MLRKRLPIALAALLAAALPAPAAAATYRVQWGDTLSGIAAAHGVSLHRLARDNGLRINGVLLAGTSLRVPGPASGSSSGWSGRYTVRFGNTLPNQFRGPGGWNLDLSGPVGDHQEAAAAGRVLPPGGLRFAQRPTAIRVGGGKLPDQRAGERTREQRNADQRVDDRAEYDRRGDEDAAAEDDMEGVGL